MRFLKLKVAAAAVASILTLTVGVTAVSAANDTDGLFQRLRQVYDVVEQHHKDGASARTFVDGAIKGGLEALGDPYTNYYSEEEFDGFLESLNGNFSGIGAYLEIEGNYVVISSPIKNAPAAKAGLQPGDRILEVNGTSLVGASTDKAVQLIRGQAGTDVSIKIERRLENRTFTVSITRAEVRIPEVDSRMLEGQIGYIELSSFGDDAVADFYAAVGKLKAEGAKGLVLDLRNNGGGYLYAAVQIASAFVPKDEPVVWEVTKEGKSAQYSTGRLIDLPAAVLVNKGSASASEILAGAIQDYKVAPLVGEWTFGKGTVQQILYLSSGGGMKVTIAEYLTPRERHVHGIGLLPEYQVENPKPDAERTGAMEFKRMLLPSMAGVDVLHVQYRLQDLGYKVETTGFVGVNTSDALDKFRKENYLSPGTKVDEVFITVLNQKVKEHWKDVQLDDLQLKKAVDLVQDQIKQ